MKISQLCIWSAFMFAVGAPIVRAAEPPIIAKARSFLGTEAALNSVKSIHFVGSLSGDNFSDPAHPLQAAVDIMVQAPYELRMTLTYEKTIETDGLNGYDGWHRHEVRADPSKWSQSVAGAGAVIQMRANVWQNLAFYRPFDREGPQIVDQGAGVIDGVMCRKIAFIHDPNTVFYRFFDISSGRLEYTASSGGNEIREEGEIMASNIRFPRKLITTIKNRDGKSQVVTIEFSSVTVNEPMPDSLFATPDPLPRSKP